MQDHTQALREALQGFLDFHTKPAGISVELITEKELFSQAMADIGKREEDLIAAARAALSNHEDGGSAATSEIVSGALFDLMGMLTSQDEVCTFSSRHDAQPAVEQLRKFAEKRGLSLEPCDVSGWSKKLVALGGEKGEAVAWMWQHEETGQVGFIDPWQKESGWEQANPRAKLIRPLFAAPVGKARMLTDEEADHITGMHNTGRSQGDSECAEAIQRKFCEVNGITLQGGA